jgi:hypothetical protein
LEEAVLMLWLESKKKGTDQLMDQFRQLQPGTQEKILELYDSRPEAGDGVDKIKRIFKNNAIHANRY